MPVAGLVNHTLNYSISVYNLTDTVFIMFFFIAHEMDYAGYMVEGKG